MNSFFKQYWATSGVNYIKHRKSEIHENQNPYHMHIFDICTNDLQNKNFIAEKL